AADRRDRGSGPACGDERGARLDGRRDPRAAHPSWERAPHPGDHDPRREQRRAPADQRVGLRPRDRHLGGRGMSDLAVPIEYDNWATEKLAQFCAALPVEQRGLTTPGTMGTIEATLIHLVGAKERYASALRGTPVPE